MLDMHWLIDDLLYGEHFRVDFQQGRFELDKISSAEGVPGPQMHTAVPWRTSRLRFLKEKLGSQAGAFGVQPANDVAERAAITAHGPRLRHFTQ